MRTTLDLPDELLKRAKIAAVERRTSLRVLVGHALERELRVPSKGSPRRRRVKFPIFAATATGALKLTNADIARTEAEEDRRRYVRSV